MSALALTGPSSFSSSFAQNTGGTFRSHPSFLATATEPLRAVGEMAAFAASLPVLLATAPPGDGHPVLVLPGFTTSDLSTLALRQFLTRLGYNARPWQLGRNTGSREVVERLGRRFHRLAVKSKEPITLVGHSLGGIFARELARQYPDDVRQVISLGSPFGLRSMGSTDRQQPPPVPTTAIYSRLDGVVHWSKCREQPLTHESRAVTENIEVPSSHIGMTVHPTILYVVADRLAQKKEGFEKFRQPGSWRDTLFSPGSAGA